jgi:hypothetical protein
VQEVPEGLVAGDGCTREEEIMVHDPQDREHWHQYGVTKELALVEFLHRNPGIGLIAKMNPAKEDSPFPPDLVVDGVISELKTQNTPFFKAQTRYGLDPQWAVSFNEADFLNYRVNHRGMPIYFWVEWQTLRGYGVTLHPLSCIYRMSYDLMCSMVPTAKLHRYQNRGGPGDKNKPTSYGLDLHRMEMIYQRIGG